MKNKIKNLFSNEYVFSVMTKVFSVCLGMVYSVFFARFVGAELKGTLAYISSIVVTGSIVLTFGIHHAYPYFRKNAVDKQELRSTFVSTTAAIYLFYSLIATSMCLVLYNTQLTVISVLMILWSYNRVQGYVVLIEKPNKRNSAIAVLTFLEALVAILFYCFFTADYYKGVFCMSFLEIGKLLFFSFELRNSFSFKRISFSHAIKVIKYGFLPMLALLMTTLNYRIDVIMLKHSNNILISEVGVYSIGVALTEKVLLIPDSIQEILLSRLAKNKGAEEVAMVARLTLPVCLFVAIAIATLGKPFLSIFYGDEFSGAYSVTIISITGTLWMVFFKMISQYNIVNRRQGINVLLLSFAILSNVILNLIFVPMWEINGAAFATAAGNALCAILFIFDFSKKTNIAVKDIVFVKKTDFIRIRNVF